MAALLGSFLRGYRCVLQMEIKCRKLRVELFLIKRVLPLVVCKGSCGAGGWRRGLCSSQSGKKWPSSFIYILQEWPRSNETRAPLLLVTLALD